MANQKGILFLGSGATAGSGIVKRSSKSSSKLPTDSQFFNLRESPLVEDLLKGGPYPTLQLVRDWDPFKGR